MPELRDNQKALDRIADSLKNTYADSIYRLRRIEVVGGASPEGSVRINRWLSEKRAGVLFDYLSRYGSLPDTLKTNTFLGRDWDGLIRLVVNLSLIHILLDKALSGFVSPFLRRQDYELQPNQCHVTVSDLASEWRLSLIHILVRYRLGRRAPAYPETLREIPGC